GRRQGPGAGYDDQERADGLPLRRRVPHRAARRLRAADPRLPARRRDAVHPRRRGRRAVGAGRLDRRGVEARAGALPELRGGDVGAVRRRRADPQGRTGVAETLKDTTVVEIERCLDALQVHEEQAEQRTSVLTHMAWVPPEWTRAAERVLEGLGPRHPSRTILLHPDPKARADRIDAAVEHECFVEGGRVICAEIVRLWLRGSTAKTPASVVVPLQLPDLPAFLRWRGKAPFGRPEFKELVGVADRLIVDSG